MSTSRGQWIGDGIYEEKITSDITLRMHRRDDRGWRINFINNDGVTNITWIDVGNDGSVWTYWNDSGSVYVKLWRDGYSEEGIRRADLLTKSFSDVMFKWAELQPHWWNEVMRRLHHKQGYT